MTITMTFDTYDECVRWMLAHDSFAWGIMPIAGARWGMYRMTAVDAITSSR